MPLSKFDHCSVIALYCYVLDDIQVPQHGVSVEFSSLIHHGNFVIYLFCRDD